ncbi:SAM-dependent methyltransferase [Edaphosphingomonas haloaromaticamans]|uniref:Cyclopropane-fatty-acyl-phospholipid synthase n=1 Tax=Edaphosphingomonas haloaromaticamans TaxID=653954 RepID=A0A1S1HN85_9SPHN|nr:cyclopropane-fatty-acyl-phospholipid synthase family protein [Sphingomonas haloaromaticamans]OHT21910.1 Cyclopropane-fatty-acyl-phospholipid synthase [Sphingomonas haloaromaticamans]
MWLLDRMLSGIVKRGVLHVTYADGTEKAYGTATPGWAEIRIRFTDKGAPNFIARNPRLGAAEAWMDGRLTVEGDDVRGLIDLLRGNAPWEKGGDKLKASFWREQLQSILARLDRINWERRSRRNVAHHYDLNGRLYDLFLDKDRQYSCAYFTDPGNSLEQAQADKKAHIAAKLDLKPGQKVLDIGCGWGGMALYLHRVADVDVLGITLSEEQLAVARRRAQEAGVADRVKFELIDYREVQGQFDRIVSVGMFEHVGPPHYRTFFDKCRTLLAEDGVMLIHTIGRMGKPSTTNAFTAKYIFPGGYIPALSEVVSASERSKLILSDLETLRVHYAWTLDIWYDRTVAARAEIEALYDARFYRMWLFYLAGAAAAFRHGGMCNYQLQYIRRRDALPYTRDYIAEAERELRAKA